MKIDSLDLTTRKFSPEGWHVASESAFFPVSVVFWYGVSHPQPAAQAAQPAHIPNLSLLCPQCHILTLDQHVQVVITIHLALSESLQKILLPCEKAIHSKEQLLEGVLLILGPFLFLSVFINSICLLS